MSHRMVATGVGLFLLAAGVLSSACGSGTRAPVSASPGEASPTAGEADASGQANPALPVVVLSPQDGAVVNSQEVEVVGTAPEGTVITVGDEILLVGPDGRFRALVPLEAGSNVIEIVASDASGKETGIMLAVTFEPES